MGIHPYVAQDREYLIALRRYFHSRPELSMAEENTARRIEEELQKIGVPARRVGGTGVLGVLRGGKGPKSPGKARLFPGKSRFWPRLALEEKI